MGNIRSYQELRVFQAAMDSAMLIFELTKRFPPDEKYSLTDQMRRASRSVCANIGEAWRKRRYQAHFVSKLSDAEMEAEETRVWLEFARRCAYLDEKEVAVLDDCYNRILGQLVRMIEMPHKWLVRNKSVNGGCTSRSTIAASPCPRVPVSFP